MRSVPGKNVQVHYIISSWKCITQVYVYLVARQSSLCGLLTVIFLVVLEGGGELCAYMLANLQLPCPRW